MTPTRLYGEPRRCPTGCGRRVRAGQLLCRTHWARVPEPVRRAVNATWRAWNHTGTPEDWAAYLDAREAAIDAVDGP